MFSGITGMLFMQTGSRGGKLYTCIQVTGEIQRAVEDLSVCAKCRNLAGHPYADIKQIDSLAACATETARPVASASVLCWD